MKQHNSKRRRRRPHFRRRTTPGAAPGIVATDPAAPRPAIRLAAYGPEGYHEQEIKQMAQIRAYLGKWPVVWVDVDALGDAAAIEALGEMFHLHRLALEDVVNTHQRPKVEPYDATLFLVAHMLSLGEHLETEQVSLFLGPGFVVSFQERPGDCFQPVRKRLRESAGKFRTSGPDYLAYALLDAVIDGYYPVLETYGERLDALEDEMLVASDQAAIGHVHRLRRDLLTMRRLVWPQREALAHLARDDSPLIAASTRVYLRDCHDHCVQLVDLIESFRELAADLRDFHMTAVSNRINDTMRVLTIIATLFIPATFIASVYGMNFDPDISPWNMPELRWMFGYPFALGLMLVAVGSMLFFFLWQGWLGGGSHPAHQTEEAAPAERRAPPA